MIKSKKPFGNLSLNKVFKKFTLDSNEHVYVLTAHRVIEVINEEPYKKKNGEKNDWNIRDMMKKLPEKANVFLVTENEEVREVCKVITKVGGVREAYSTIKLLLKVVQAFGKIEERSWKEEYAFIKMLEQCWFESKNLEKSSQLKTKIVIFSYICFLISQTVFQSPDGNINLENSSHFQLISKTFRKKRFELMKNDLAKNLRDLQSDLFSQLESSKKEFGSKFTAYVTEITRSSLLIECCQIRQELQDKKLVNDSIIPLQYSVSEYQPILDILHNLKVYVLLIKSEKTVPLMKIETFSETFKKIHNLIEDLQNKKFRSRNMLLLLFEIHALCLSVLKRLIKCINKKEQDMERYKAIYETYRNKKLTEELLQMDLAFTDVIPIENMDRSIDFLVVPVLFQCNVLKDSLISISKETYKNNFHVFVFQKISEIRFKTEKFFEILKNLSLELTDLKKRRQHNSLQQKNETINLRNKIIKIIITCNLTAQSVKKRNFDFKQKDKINEFLKESCSLCDDYKWTCLKKSLTNVNSNPLLRGQINVSEKQDMKKVR